MALTDRENRLASLALSGPLGDNEVRRAVLALLADELGFSRSGGALTGRLLITGTQVGAVTTPATSAAEEQGDAVSHVTRIALTDFQVHATEPDAADLAIGAKFYTLPPGAYLLESASLRGSFTKAGEATIADGEVGIGTIVGAGAEDALGDVGAAAENVLGPIVLSNSEFDGAAIIAGVSAPGLYIATAGGLAHDLFLNIAATWPDVEPDGAITFTGVITLKWRKID